eukprot:1403712-Pyramimonas_sp.AAC.1
MMCRLLEVGLCYDQLRGSNPAVLEPVARAIQTENESFESTAGLAVIDNRMTGMTHGRKHICACPPLRDHAAAQLQKGAAIGKK